MVLSGWYGGLCLLNRTIQLLQLNFVYFVIYQQKVFDSDLGSMIAEGQHKLDIQKIRGMCLL